MSNPNSDARWRNYHANKKIQLEELEKQAISRVIASLQEEMTSSDYLIMVDLLPEIYTLKTLIRCLDYLRAHPNLFVPDMVEYAVLEPEAKEEVKGTDHAS